ncbi:MAG TPA: UdgX family uracil-DNA binding protein [Verrucomicrobiae bacterium]|nr:UdgX family uracil-DNA binding protein [Verrucomicrobiae bacterium]
MTRLTNVKAPQTPIRRVTTRSAMRLPAAPTLERLRAQAASCRACPLWKPATQTVFGEGPPGSRVMIIGEVPGNEEDIQGRPFVGPAGRLLREALEKVGIDVRKVYLTNVVKHFKFEPRGKHRLHKKPNAMEMSACRPWLDAELQALKPQVIICLGATAAQALLGRAFRVSQQRGQNVSSSLAPFVLATVHPSSILRIPEQTLRRQAREEFIADLRVAARAIARIN